MPHVDGMSLMPDFRQSGESRFAGPVAAITSLVVSSFESARMAAARCARAQVVGDPQARRGLRGATDLPDLERMERDWDRRDGGGMRTWDWR